MVAPDASADPVPGVSVRMGITAVFTEIVWVCPLVDEIIPAPVNVRLRLRMPRNSVAPLLSKTPLVAVQVASCRSSTPKAAPGTGAVQLPIPAQVTVSPPV